VLEGAALLLGNGNLPFFLVDHLDDAGVEEVCVEALLHLLLVGRDRLFHLNNGLNAAGEVDTPAWAGDHKVTDGCEGQAAGNHKTNNTVFHPVDVDVLEQVNLADGDRLELDVPGLHQGPCHHDGGVHVGEKADGDRRPETLDASLDDL